MLDVTQMYVLSMAEVNDAMYQGVQTLSEIKRIHVVFMVEVKDVRKPDVKNMHWAVQIDV